MSEQEAQSPVPDHRKTVARERRERMRTRLLDATLKVWGSKDGVSEATVIRDVVEEAGVSRATFYKHFSSLNEASAALGSRLSDEMVGELAPIQRQYEDMRMHASVGIQIFLWRGVHDPLWGMFVSRSHHVVTDTSPFIRQISRDLLNGRSRGELNFARLDVALALSIGSLKDGIDAVSQGVESPADFIEALTAMTLIGLGADPVAAAKTSAECARHLPQVAPALYDWWPASD